MLNEYLDFYKENFFTVIPIKLRAKAPEITALGKTAVRKTSTLLISMTKPMSEWFSAMRQPD